MKKLLLLLGIVMPFFLQAQNVIADPALNPMRITTLTHGNVVPSQLLLSNVIKLKVPILNKDSNNALPVGTCRVKIGLGSKIILDPLYSLVNINTTNYFNWTVTTTGGQVQLTGDLTVPLPALYSDTLFLNIQGSILGASTITTNFLVSNHNPPAYLSDADGSNNISFIPYIIVAGAVPVTFINVFAENKDCQLKVTANIENEINVSHYDLELSNELNQFEKVVSVNANQLTQYVFEYAIAEKFQVKKLLYRLKSVDLDGTFRYSNVKAVRGLCNLQSSLSLYPNPVQKNTSLVYIQKNNGLFNGIYSLIITDIMGKLVQTNQLQLNSVNQFSVTTSTLAAGQYFIRIVEAKTKNIEYLKMIKL